ncbi:MAG: phosphoenolpyruvate carboxykinase (ATP) [Candidatus Nitrosoabyssus spongiisocia]|nr:MAG: phosphoenolpyruvate carboxykinase (ATP) [Nitrosopumilaceae archaeon AB1(1)]
MQDDSTSNVQSNLSKLGFMDIIIHRNLSSEELIRLAVENKEGDISSMGALTVKTGKYTGRSPHDRFIVEDPITADTVDWGKINHKFSTAHFDQIFNKMLDFAKNKNLYVFDGYVGSDKDNRLAIRVINDHPWQNLFAQNIFVHPDKNNTPNDTEFTLLCLNGFTADPNIDGTNSDVFILINFTKKLVLIGGTRYAGEMKKSMFSVMNFLLPQKNIFPMHCSANMDEKGNTALFFGLSGTGKTTLSADPNRHLIGDDEHGWSDIGIQNFEGGCYAKCINLKKKNEPQIWNAIRSGSVLENVTLDESGIPNFDDNSLTENTRVVYPLSFIPNAVIPSLGNHPKVIIFLTADALGILPPVSKLTMQGAMYHFISGYTSKLAGTERGIKEPKAVFSECFGAPFMPRPAAVYAKMLGEKINKHNTSVYLINTGWSGGPFGIGKRIELKFSRFMVTNALEGKFDNVSFNHNDLLNLDIPTFCDGVPSEILNPRNIWTNKNHYDASAKNLAKMFVNNFVHFKDVSDDIIAAGPSL